MQKYGHKQPSQKELLAIMIGKRKEGYEHITFVGGEPTIHPDFIKILSAAKRLKYKTLLITDGQKLSQWGFALETLPWLDELVFSLHGPIPEIHDALTQRTGSFERQMRAMDFVEKIRREPFYFTSTVLTRLNFPHLESLVDLVCARPGAKGCLISNLTPNEDDPVGLYSEQAVRLNLLSKTFSKLINIARNQGKNIRFLGFPACALGRAREFSADCQEDFPLDVERMVRDSGLELEDSRQYGPRRSRFFPAVCGSCAWAGKRCMGILRAYYDHFGGLELAPIEGSVLGEHSHAV